MSRSDVRRLFQRGHLVTAPRMTLRRADATPGPGRTAVLDRPSSFEPSLPHELPPHHALVEERFGRKPSTNERTYFGIRTAEVKFVTAGASHNRVYVIERNDTVRELHPTRALEFEWGVCTSGSFDLGLAILSDAIGIDYAHEHFDPYTRERIATIPADMFVIRISEVQEWAKEQAS